MSNPLDAIYAKFEAMDNQDVPLEQYPQAAVNALACAGWAVVPCDLPSDVLGEAARNGTMETGNPKHVWDYMISKTRLYPAPKPDSAAPGGDVERRARELLAAEYELMGYKALVAGVREFPFAVLSDGDAAAIRAIIAALSAPKQVGAAANDVRPGDGHRWGDFSRNELCDLIDQLSDQVRETGTKQWPFVESPGALANRIDMATRDFPLVGALRHVFIENPPTFIIPRPAPQPVEAEGREAALHPDLHPSTALLVERFSAALAYKLAQAEKKYGYSDGWASRDWMDECRAKLVEHIAKGDPRDVAAYCAFLWHHGESTTSQPKQPAIDLTALTEVFKQAQSAEFSRLEPITRPDSPGRMQANMDAATAVALRAVLAIIDGAKGGQ